MEKRKLGLFFGSFNPIHNGHLMVAKYALENKELDSVFFVVSPQNPFKNKEDLIDVSDRIEMVEASIANEAKFILCDYEVKNGYPSYTFLTIEHFKKEFPNDELVLIIGLDNWINIDSWKNYQYIADNVTFLVFPRIYDDQKQNCEDIWFRKLLKLIKKGRIKSEYVGNTPITKLSSTFIRNEIKNGKDIMFYIPDSVYNIIKEKKLYG